MVAKSQLSGINAILLTTMTPSTGQGRNQKCKLTVCQRAVGNREAGKRNSEVAEMAETETRRWREWSHEHYLCKITFNEVTSWRSVLLHYHYRNKLYSLFPHPWHPQLGYCVFAKLPAKLHLTRMPITWRWRCQRQADWQHGSQAAWLPSILMFWQAAGVLDRTIRREWHSSWNARRELPQSGLNMNKRYLSKLHYPFLDWLGCINSLH